jgi:hypothetical protein
VGAYGVVPLVRENVPVDVGFGMIAAANNLAVFANQGFEIFQ